ncbi:DNA-processing protein DprA [Frigoribacterium sp. 2-23]|uniref:DNA-processing protein DprA n=1 Tax=Frigoribacterium sp. 2-23 TaxID=3415006 RepID=UPI003C6FE7F7
MNELLTLPATTLADLVRPVLAEADEGVSSAPAAVEAFAYAAWSGIAEPGDSTGGLLRRTLGAAGSLRLVLEAAALPEAAATGLIVRALLATGDTDATRHRVDRALARWRPRLDATRITTSFTAARALGLRVVTPTSADWPEVFDELGDHAPAALWLRGHGRLPVTARSVALVGARAATRYGEQVAADLSSALGVRGATIVSGAAYGIDGMAHRAALAADAATVAVMANGVDRFYPSGHDDLLRRVIDSADGLMISESPCGTTPSRWRFLQRNRLIATLTSATVVVEAGNRSGSLNTANHAAQLGRPVGAVPGPITSPSSAGCHRLIRAGLATCVTSAADVVELLGAPSAEGEAGAERQPSLFDDGTPEQARVRDALSTRTARSVDEVTAASGLSRSDTRGVLAELELAGAVEERPGGWVKRRRTSSRS